MSVQLCLSVCLSVSLSPPPVVTSLMYRWCKRDESRESFVYLTAMQAPKTISKRMIYVTKFYHRSRLTIRSCPKCMESNQIVFYTPISYKKIVGLAELCRSVVVMWQTVPAASWIHRDYLFTAFLCQWRVGFFPAMIKVIAWWLVRIGNIKIRIFKFPSNASATSLRRRKFCSLAERCESDGHSLDEKAPS